MMKYDRLQTSNVVFILPTTTKAAVSSTAVAETTLGSSENHRQTGRGGGRFMFVLRFVVVCSCARIRVKLMILAR